VEALFNGHTTVLEVEPSESIESVKIKFEAKYPSSPFPPLPPSSLITPEFLNRASISQTLNSKMLKHLLNMALVIPPLYI
jgi:hypothetical protein